MAPSHPGQAGGEVLVWVGADGLGPVRPAVDTRNAAEAAETRGGNGGTALGVAVGTGHVPCTQSRD